MEFIFDNYTDAEQTQNNLKYDISTYGFVSVADLLVLQGVTLTCRDYTFGWHDPSQIGHIVPKMLPLEQSKQISPMYPIVNFPPPSKKRVFMLNLDKPTLRPDDITSSPSKVFHRSGDAIWGSYKTATKIKDVIFNDPATIVFWSDGSKTVVKTQNGEEFDPEKGLAMAIAKHSLGNNGSYYDIFVNWLSKKEEPKEPTVIATEVNVKTNSNGLPCMANLADKELADDVATAEAIVNKEAKKMINKNHIQESDYISSCIIPIKTLPDLTSRSDRHSPASYDILWAFINKKTSLAEVDYKKLNYKDAFDGYRKLWQSIRQYKEFNRLQVVKRGDHVYLIKL